MLRFAFIAAFCLATPISMHAQEVLDPRVEAILDQMPTQDEVDELLAQMPDLNAMMTGMMDIAQDPETVATLERVGARLEQRFASLELSAAEGELPDLNLLMEEVMGLATDRETAGDLLTLMFQVVDVVEDAAGER